MHQVRVFYFALLLFAVPLCLARDLAIVADAHKADIQAVGSDEIVLTMVDNNPGAIGIINVYSINSHVKVLKVDQQLPMEQG